MEKSWVCSQVIHLDLNNVKNLRASEKKERERAGCIFSLYLMKHCEFLALWERCITKSH